MADVAMIDRAKVEKALAIAEKIGMPLSISVSVWNGEETNVHITTYASDAVERVLPLVKRIKRTLSHCSGSISGEAEVDGVEIRIPCIEKHKEKIEELSDLVAE